MSLIAGLLLGASSIGYAGPVVLTVNDEATTFMSWSSAAEGAARDSDGTAYWGDGSPYVDWEYGVVDPASKVGRTSKNFAWSKGAGKTSTMFVREEGSPIEPPSGSPSFRTFSGAKNVVFVRANAGEMESEDIGPVEATSPAEAAPVSLLLVPEPGSLALLGAMFVTVGLWGRRSSR